MTENDDGGNDAANDDGIEYKHFICTQRPQQNLTNLYNNLLPLSVL